MTPATRNPATKTTETAKYTTSPGRSRNMAAIRRTDTKPEIAVRSLLHRRGVRFRKDYALVLDGTRVRPDIAFTRVRIAIFIDGCFWHCCPEHGRQPGKNTEYWAPKLRSNVERDRRQTEALQQEGWRVLRFWTHETPEAIANQAAAVVFTARKNTRDSAATQ